MLPDVAETPKIQLQLLRLLEASQNSWKLPAAAEQYYLAVTKRICNTQVCALGLVTNICHHLLYLLNLETMLSFGTTLDVV